jgi:hypothetical protein
MMGRTYVKLTMKLNAKFSFLKQDIDLCEKSINLGLPERLRDHGLEFSPPDTFRPSDRPRSDSAR